jgi:hypothetical protein
MNAVAPRDANPYVGPRPFEREHDDLFFGRKREIRQLFYLLIAERILLLHSPSGAGKTSLIQAGLIPTLEKEKKSFQILRAMRVGNIPRPSELKRITVRNRYVLSALQSLEEALPKRRRMSLTRLAGMEFGAYLDQRWPLGEDQPNQVLIFDQFEELLTADPTDQPDKAEFFRQVGTALRYPRRWALFAMREDFLAGLDPYLLPVPGRLQTRFRLDLLERPAAREAIQEPSGIRDVQFRDDAADELLGELSKVRVQLLDGTSEWKDGPYVEPIFLQVACQRLWELKGSRREITADLVRSIGNVDDALADYYAERTATIAADTRVPERAIREWFDRHLITSQGFRGQVLQGRDSSQGLHNEAIWRLVDAHLVRREERRGATWFELAHDRLIEPLRRDNDAWYRTQEGTSITVRIHDWDRRTESHHVEATLDDGSFFYGGELRLDEQALRQVEHDPQAYGTLLFDALFAGPMRRAYEAAIQRARERTRGRLRFRLWIDSESMDMHTLPWERLCHFEQGQPVPLSTSELVSFSRYKGLPSVEPSPISERPLRLLIAISNPANLQDFRLPAIDVEQEMTNYDAALGDLQRDGLIQVTLMPGISGLTPELQAELRGKGYQIEPGITQWHELLRLLPHYHVFHFHGYGGLDMAGAGYLLAEGSDGQIKIATEDDLMPRLAAIPLPRLVVLDAQEMVGLAPKWIRAGVPAVLTFHGRTTVHAAMVLM